MDEAPSLRHRPITRTPRNCANLFMQGMSLSQRKRFYSMAQHGHVNIGSISLAYNVQKDELMRELSALEQE